jgi:hypothetical protein
VCVRACVRERACGVVCVCVYSFRYPVLYLNFLDRFSKNSQISNFMKICPVGAEFFDANGRTDMMKPVVVFFFRNFAKAPKKHE